MARFTTDKTIAYCLFWCPALCDSFVNMIGWHMIISHDAFNLGIWYLTTGLTLSYLSHDGYNLVISYLTTGLTLSYRIS